MAFKYDWFSENIPVWTKLLKKFKGKRNLIFLEIGCFEGKATKWLLENILTHQSSKIIVIDTFKGGTDQKKIGIDTNYLLDRFKENVKKYISDKPSENKILIRQGYSSDILRKLSLKSKFDFIYIDGSHLAKDVLEDAVLSWALLKKNGIIIFDDFAWDKNTKPTLNPKIAINSFLKVYKGEYNVIHIGYQLAIEKSKKIKKLPISSLQKMKLIYNEDLEKINRDMEEKLLKTTEQLSIIKNSKMYLLIRTYFSFKSFFAYFKSSK